MSFYVDWVGSWVILASVRFELVVVALVSEHHLVLFEVRHETVGFRVQCLCDYLLHLFLRFMVDLSIVISDTTFMIHLLIILSRIIISQTWDAFSVFLMYNAWWCLIVRIVVTHYINEYVWSLTHIYQSRFIAPVPPVINQVPAFNAFPLFILHIAFVLVGCIQVMFAFEKGMFLRLVGVGVVGLGFWRLHQKGAVIFRG